MSSEPGNAVADAQLAARVEALSRNLRALEEEVDELNGEVETLKREKAEMREEFEAELAEQRSRTDLLSLVDQADELGSKQKSAILIQNLHRKAKRKRERGKKPHASITRSQAEDILQNIDQDRTTFYTDMERAARLVGEDNDVITYDSNANGSRLMMKLDKGDLPSSKDGVQLHTDAHGGR